jgi:RHS repeat-associated protein
MEKIALKELHLYGNRHLGHKITDKALSLSPVATATALSGYTFTVAAWEEGYQHRKLGKKYYELANHLGNVLAVVTDRKAPDDADSNSDDIVDTYWPDVVKATDYYPFGMEMPGRTLSSPDYRYGFNGKENDTEWGAQLIQDYGFRLYNPALGRFLSVDPLMKGYPSWTPYSFAMNRVIDGIDLDGLEYLSVNHPALEPGEKASFTRKIVANFRQKYFNLMYNKVSIAGQDFYDIGKHMFYNDNTGMLSTKGTRSEQATFETKVGIQLIENIKNLPNSPSGYDPPPTWDKPELSYDVANQYQNCKGMCFAVSMARINEAFSNLDNEKPLSLFPTSAKNQDYNISGTVDRPSIPQNYLGFGVGGALVKDGYGTLVDNAGVWSGMLQSGAAMQYWYGASESEVIQNLNDRKRVSGHSFIFNKYNFDSNGNIIGFEAYDYSGAKTFKKNDGKIFLGANLKDKDQ